jgi:membrane protease YdiL (CAAX protease family)
MQGQRAWRSVLAIGGLMALLALVAVAAAGHAPSSGASRPSAPAPKLLQDYIGTLALLLLPVGLILFVWAALMRRLYKDVPLKRPTAFPINRVRRRFFSQIMIIIALTVLVVRFHPFDNRKQGPGTSNSTPAATPSTADQKRKQYEPQFRWLPMIVVGSLIVGLGGALAVLAARRQRELLAATPIRETLADVLDETLDDLRNQEDPRKAVIGAYANMERTLAARGVPRRESEAPTEYLTRILEVVSASGHSVRRLTGLFSRARYSPHEIDAEMKEEAIDALTGLRAELQVGM